MLQALFLILLAFVAISFACAVRLGDDPKINSSARPR
jgi:hypothetical protein